MALIKEHREFHGLTQVQLAKAVPVSRSLLAEWETGRRVPNEARLKALARALDTTLIGLYQPPGQGDPSDKAVDQAILSMLDELSEAGKEEALAYIDFLRTRHPRDAVEK